MMRHRAAWLILSALAAASACAPREAPVTQRELELGSHKVLVSVPDGWDVLDQGTHKRFRKGEAEIELQFLGKVDWEAALASLHDDRRREVKSRRAIIVGRHEALDVETWNRLDHTWPQRVLLVRADEDLLALHTPRHADADTLKAFESIRDSLHFVPILRE